MSISKIIPSNQFYYYTYINGNNIEEYQGFCIDQGYEWRHVINGEIKNTKFFESFTQWFNFNREKRNK